MEKGRSSSGAATGKPRPRATSRHTALLLMRAARHQTKTQIDDFAGRASWRDAVIGRQ